MRKILFLIATLYSFTCLAQIDVRYLYDSNTKTIVLLVRNNTDKLYRLCPFSGRIIMNREVLLL